MAYEPAEGAPLYDVCGLNEALTPLDQLSARNPPKFRRSNRVSPLGLRAESLVHRDDEIHCRSRLATIVYRKSS